MSADAAPAASSNSGTVEHGGFTLSGNTPAETVKESLKVLDKPKGGAADEADPVAQAASELGKKGGKASAAARKAAAKAAPATEPAPEKPAAEAAPAAEPDEGDDEEPAAAEEKRSRAQERVQEATRKAADERRARERAERETQELRERVARLEGRREAAEPEPAERRETRPAAQDDEPQLDRFLAEHDDYNKGLAAYLEARDKHRDAQREKQARGEQRVQGIRTRVQAFNQKITEAGGAEFVSGLTEDVQNLRPSFSLQQGERPSAKTFLADAVVLNSEHAPGILRHLSDHPREFQRIAELGSPYLISFEVGKIVARLEGATAGSSSSTERQESKPASKAPAPVRPVTGAPSAAAGPYGPRPGEDFDAWFSRTGGKTAAR